MSGNTKKCVLGAMATMDDYVTVILCETVMISITFVTFEN